MRCRALLWTRLLLILLVTSFDHGQAYALLNTVSTLEGVLLIGLIGALIDKNQSYVHDEYARLPGCPIS